MKQQFYNVGVLGSAFLFSLFILFAGCGEEVIEESPKEPEQEQKGEKKAKTTEESTSAEGDGDVADNVSGMTSFEQSLNDFPGVCFADEDVVEELFLHLGFFKTGEVYENGLANFVFTDSKFVLSGFGEFTKSEQDSLAYQFAGELEEGLTVGKLKETMSGEFTLTVNSKVEMTFDDFLYSLEGEEKKFADVELKKLLAKQLGEFGLYVNGQTYFATTSGKFEYTGLSNFESVTVEAMEAETTEEGVESTTEDVVEDTGSEASAESEEEVAEEMTTDEDVMTDSASEEEVVSDETMTTTKYTFGVTLTFVVTADHNSVAEKNDAACEQQALDAEEEASADEVSEEATTDSEGSSDEAMEELEGEEASADEVSEEATTDSEGSSSDEVMEEEGEE
ncbi:MAG: hypothetical protein OXC40_06750 [Proteobacteria bacterium]|nr:hypothetical protein [Pseudomonadota bacterium]